MTPIEHGNLLINKFYNLHAWEVLELDKRKIEYDIAKQAAIICVEQIMVAIENVAGGYNSHWEDREVAAFEYYKEVLDHIKAS